MQHFIAFQLGLQPFFFGNKQGRIVQAMVRGVQAHPANFLEFLNQLSIICMLWLYCVVVFPLLAMHNKNTDVHFVSFGLPSNPSVVVVGVCFLHKQHSKPVLNRRPSELKAIKKKPSDVSPQRFSPVFETIVNVDGA